MLSETHILNFNIGGFSQGNEKIIWRDNKLYHFFYESFFDQNFVIPLTRDWEQFWEVIDTINVWGWEKEYHTDDILDGTQWELKIKRPGKRKRRIFGSNAYPKNFMLLINALNKLLKSKIDFGEDDLL